MSTRRTTAVFVLLGKGSVGKEDNKNLGGKAATIDQMEAS